MGLVVDIAVFTVLIVGIAILFLVRAGRRSTPHPVDDSILWSRDEPPKQKYGKYEEECRRIFEDMFHRPFNKIRPNFLRNPVTGSNLELDGYCPDIHTSIGRGVAFEYDGRQHSAYTRKFHRSVDEFIYSVRKDSWKDMQCKRHGVVLIRIPHFVPYDKLEAYIRNRLVEEKIHVPVKGRG